jgi:[ribosomal protein S5]-alanine N-acetyltransferase
VAGHDLLPEGRSLTTPLTGLAVSRSVIFSVDCRSVNTGVGRTAIWSVPAARENGLCRRARTQNRKRLLRLQPVNKPMQIAETERLILREFTPADAEDFYRIHTDAETMRFQVLPENYSVEVERYYLGRHIERYYKTLGFGIWALVLKENNRLIGRCGLVRQPLEGGEEIEVSYLVEREFWNRGFASEAASAALTLGFDKYNLPGIVAFIDPRNTASARVAEKIGMRFERKVEFRSFGEVDLYTAQKPG